ncbi:hypothetical protein AB0436_04320 [Streptomyces sp. NPDC051322]|uniref:hypothetical protein n=1 Tax=Streptomyces sp. NPDC051322 TaxID=3154645 RepID=UPI00344D3D8C
MTLRLRGKLQWVPVGAVIVLAAWVVAIPPVMHGAYGAIGGTLMVIAGVLLAVFTVTFVGYLVRPLRIEAREAGLTVRLPTWPTRTVPWAALAGVSGVVVASGGRTRSYVVVDFAPGADALPGLCRPRSMYRRLGPAMERGEGAKGLCLEEEVFVLDPAGLLAAIGRCAPAGVPVSGPHAESYGTPEPGSARPA